MNNSFRRLWCRPGRTAYRRPAIRHSSEQSLPQTPPACADFFPPGACYTDSCPHCQRAKGYLERAGIAFTYHNVVSSPRALYEMLGRVKPLIGAKTPITVPQIWLDGIYIGGAEQLETHVKEHVEPNPERGRCSLSAPR